MLIKSFGTFLLVVFSLAFTRAQEVVIHDLSYILSEADESKIKNCCPNLSFHVEVFTPRKYAFDSLELARHGFSDVQVQLVDQDPGYNVNIKPHLPNLANSSFLARTDSLKRIVSNDYFGNNLLVEGIIFLIQNLRSKSSDCQLEIKEIGAPFTPDIDNDELQIEFKISSDNYQYIKLVIAEANGLSPIYSTSSLISKVEGKVLRWNGRIASKNSFVTSASSPLVATVLVSKDSSFANSVAENIPIAISREVDEWNSHKSTFEGYVVRDQFNGTNFEFYRDRLRTALIANIPEIYMEDGKSPLDYLAENLERVRFLGASFLTHKKFAVKLMEVEEDLRSHGFLEQISAEYRTLVNGSFALRKIHNRNYISPHSLAAAIDIDPDRNPHIKDDWGREVFSVIQYITGTQMYLNKPSIHEMKVANKNFKLRFTQEYIDKITSQSSMSQLDVESFNNRFKCGGDADTEIKALYEDSQEAIRKYFEIERAVSDSEKAAKQQAMNDVLLIVQDINMFANKIDSLISLAPNIDFEDKIGKTMSINKQCILDKINVTKVAKLDFEGEYSKVNEIHCSIPIDLSYETLNKQLVRIQEIYPQMVKNKTALVHMSQVGFFELDERLVESFVSKNLIRWGGHYNNQKDFMHFELYPIPQSLE